MDEESIKRHAKRHWQKVREHQVRIGQEKEETEKVCDKELERKNKERERRKAFVIKRLLLEVLVVASIQCSQTKLEWNTYPNNTLII